MSVFRNSPSGITLEQLNAALAGFSGGGPQPGEIILRADDGSPLEGYERIGANVLPLPIAPLAARITVTSALNRTSAGSTLYSNSTGEVGYAKQNAYSAARDTMYGIISSQVHPLGPGDTTTLWPLGTTVTAPVAIVVNDDIYVTQGTSSTIRLYKMALSSGIVATMAEPPVAPSGIGDGAPVKKADNSAFYILGGRTALARRYEICKYDVINNVWSVLPVALPATGGVGWFGGRAFVMADGRLVLLSTPDATPALATIFDPETETLTPIDPCPSGVKLCVGAQMGETGLVVAFSGLGDPNGFTGGLATAYALETSSAPGSQWQLVEGGNLGGAVNCNFAQRADGSTVFAVPSGLVCLLEAAVTTTPKLSYFMKL